MKLPDTVNHLKILNKYGRWAGLRHLAKKKVPIEEAIQANALHHKYCKKG